MSYLLAYLHLALGVMTDGDVVCALVGAWLLVCPVLLAGFSLYMAVDGVRYRRFWRAYTGGMSYRAAAEAYCPRLVR